MSKLKTREQVAQEFKWNLATAFASDAAWEAGFHSLSASLGSIKVYEGTLGESSNNLISCLETVIELEGNCRRLYVYAHLKKDEDVTNPIYQGMADRVASLVAKCDAATSFLRPEIIAIGQDRVNAFVMQDTRLEVYSHLFDDLFRTQKHTLSPDNERLLAKAYEVGQAASSIFGMIKNADMAFPNATDGNGIEHEVTHGRYGLLMENADRTLRKNVFDTIANTYIAQKNTIAESYNFSVKNDMFMAEARNFGSSLEASLSGYNIPTEIYKNLISTVGDSIHLYHRYLDLRKKCLKYDELYMWDMNVPLMENADTHMSWEDAKTTVVAGLGLLGSDYQALVKNGFDEGWVDVYENKGKRSGAYSWGAYGFPHPYVLMNYDDTIDDMFTLAHEMGHALHTHYTHTNQPFIYGHYSFFLAEVASTVNEALLMDYLLNNTTDKTKYNYLLNYFLRQFVGTFFYQTMLAEFELLTHEMAENGEALNAESLCNLYRKLCEKHYGSGVIIDDKAGYIWSRIPHFYRAFYVYQYATGFTAAMALSKKIREEGEPALEKYLSLLKSGAKDYPINLLKEAGVDMTSPAPIKDALAIFEDLLDRFEKANFS